MFDSIIKILYFNSFMYLVWLAVGFFVLIKGADVLVDSSSSIAKRLGVSPFIIGLSIVAFGTSMPETVVGIFSAVQKTNQLSFGNVIGAGIANVALIIGITSMVTTLDVGKEIVLKEIPMSFFVELFLCVLACIGGGLETIDGILLIILFAAFLYYIFKNSKAAPSNVNQENSSVFSGEEIASTAEQVDVRSMKLLSTMLILGLLGLFAGGQMVVSNATGIARLFGISETLIGLTIVAIGTTLPEMVATLTAAFKRQTDIAVGNIIGSNIFNILCVLGISVTINPITNLNIFSGSSPLWIDMFLMLLVTILLFVFTLVKKKVTKTVGFLFISIYVSYLLMKIITVV